MSFLKRTVYFIQNKSIEISRDIKLASLQKSYQQLLTWDSIRNTECLFILSTGRCGTKFLTKIFTKSQQTWVEHSPKPELAHQSSLIYRNNVSNEALKWSFIHARLDILSQIYKANLKYIETNNRITLYAPAIAEILPKSKFIHLIRHPGEFVRSGMRRGYYERINPEKSGHLIPRLDDPVFKQWPNWDRIEKIAWQWNEINQTIEEFRETIESNRFLRITSDQLFFEDSIFAKISQFTGISLPDGIEIEKIKKYPVNRQRTGYFPKYSDWSVEQKTLLKRQAHLASLYGYNL